MRQTTDHEEAVAWTRDIAGTPNVAEIWVPQRGFIKAVRRLGSVALTRQDGSVFGIVIGPDPLIDPSWQRIALPRNLPASHTEGLVPLSEWDVFTGSTTLAPTTVTSEPIYELDEIASFLTLHAPDASTPADSDEAQLWFGMRHGAQLIAVATIARWESGAHMLSSVAVHRDHRGRGIGRQLARDALFIGRHNDIAHICLAVRHGNSAAIAAYRAAGYHTIGEYATYRPRPERVEVATLADVEPKG